MSEFREGAIEDVDGSGQSPFVQIAGDPTSSLLLLCDHASNRVPEGIGDLGLSASEFERHIAYDPGAEAVTRALAERLSAPAIMSTFSRLVIDPNRGRDDPTLVMKLSDGAIIPGNRRVDDDERRRRIANLYEPYHSAIDAAIEERLEAGIVPVLVSIHSFTPAWRGQIRPWQVGILWDRDPRLAVPLVAALRADDALTVGDNEPYSGALRNDTMYRHGTRRGLAHALVELRQDLIAEDAGVQDWAERLAAVLVDLNQREEMHEIRHYGSRTQPPDPMCSPVS